MPDFIKDLDFAMIFSILIPLGSFIGFLMRVVQKGRQETKEEIKKIETQMDAQSKRTDNLYEIFMKEANEQSLRSNRLYEIFMREMNEQSSRSNRLYEMFIDLLKENRIQKDP
jgi:hypothetical protein